MRHWFIAWWCGHQLRGPAGARRSCLVSYPHWVPDLLPAGQYLLEKCEWRNRGPHRFWNLTRLFLQQSVTQDKIAFSWEYIQLRSFFKTLSQTRFNFRYRVATKMSFWKVLVAEAISVHSQSFVVTPLIRNLIGAGSNGWLCKSWHDCSRTNRSFSSTSLPYTDNDKKYRLNV